MGGWREKAPEELYGKLVIARGDIYAIDIYIAGMLKWIKLVGEKMQYPKKLESIREIKDYLTQ